MAITVQKYDTADNNLLEKCGHGYKLITGYLSFATYITDGVPMDMSLDFPNRLHFLIVEPKGGYIFNYDYTNRTLLAYYADYSTGTDSVLIQVADDLDISKAVSNCHFMAIGM